MPLHLGRCNGGRDSLVALFQKDGIQIDRKINGNIFQLDLAGPALKAFHGFVGPGSQIQFDGIPFVVLVIGDTPCNDVADRLS
jgi:hypothetical protein